MKRNILTWALAAMIALPGGAWAEDLAVIIANDTYEARPPVGNGTDVIGLQSSFQQAGYTVQVLRNTKVPIDAEDANRLWARMNGANKLVILLSGHMVNAQGQTYLLHANVGDVSPLTLGQAGLPIAPYLALAAGRQGDAVIVLADDGAFQDHGAGINDGVLVPDIPQGVTWISGSPSDVAAFVAGPFTVPGLAMQDAAEQGAGTVQVLGFVPRSTPFVAGVTGVEPLRQDESAFWQEARARNTLEAYGAYLERYPNGQFAGEARQREANLQLTPADRARLAEDSLGLSRDQRRGVQRNLTLLGFDTLGVDGLFGRNTRKALAAWQNDVGIDGFGYLTINQITQLEVSGALRAEELRVEAEKRRLAVEVEDRKVWEQTGQGSTEEGLREYLQKYPDGLFSQPARKRLDEIERERRRQAEAVEREAWNTAVMQGTADSFLRYLDAYPNGVFRDEAQARYNVLNAPEVPQSVLDGAKQEEARLGLNGFTRKLIEAQLRSLNIDPGRVDGQFTNETRKALRNYQRANGLAATGYVTRDTIVRLLAAAVE